MRIGQPNRLLFILCDWSGSMKNETYIANAANSLIERERAKKSPILVTLAGFGDDTQHDSTRMFIDYKCRPINKVMPVKFTGTGGSSPIWESIIDALGEIEGEVHEFPILVVDFVVITDFKADDNGAAHKCRTRIIEALKRKWNQTALIPYGQKEQGYYKPCGFPEDRVMEVPR